MQRSVTALIQHDDSQPGKGACGCLTLALLLALLLPPPLAAQDELVDRLAELTRERELLSLEVDQYEKTLAILAGDGTPPEQSANPAVRTLAAERQRLKERLVQVTEAELALLQEQIALARDAAESAAIATTPVESKPIDLHSRGYTLEQERENVGHLLDLLGEYYTDLQESAQTLPSAAELARREAAHADAQRLARIPYSVSKVRLTGQEGSLALAQISERLSDSNIPESRRDMAPICTIKTRLLGQLVTSESRSLRPVGKNHYLARVTLQAGDTTLHIRNRRWDIQLPQDMAAIDYLVTLYAPPAGDAELHIFPVSELLADSEAHIPAWLPPELELPRPAG
ncbi:MAG: hypothetical protein AAGI11_13975 [Pseudomonadota bacterium]